jgi:thioesterase domain-containing protein
MNRFYAHVATGDQQAGVMREAELETFLRERIPLSKAMDVRVKSISAGQVVLSAPIAPNLNHRDTAFGGSASALAILAAWSVVRVRMQDERVEGRIVIRRNTMSYDQPMAADFSATACAPDEAEWERLRAALARGRPGRVRVKAFLECLGARAGELTGEFVVLPQVDGTVTPSRMP